MASLLKGKDHEQLSEWIGRECYFELVYKITRDGASGQGFHALCDNKGPTVTVFYNTDNNVYGGYLCESWNKNKTWSKDENSFLFQLYHNGKWKAKNFPFITDKGNNFWGNIDHGPWFYELHSFQQGVGKTSGFYALDSDDLFHGCRYNLGGENAETIANGHNNVADLEVYLVKGILERPWKEPPEWNLQYFSEMKSSISTYEPFEDAKILASNVLLIGQTGSGKSSFVNTINTIFKGKISSRACTGRRANNQSLTKHFMKYHIRDCAEKKKMKFMICDTLGIDTKQSYWSTWMTDKDLGYMLEGNLPNQYTFDLSVSASEKVVKATTLHERSHVVCFVIDGSNICSLTYGITEKLQQIKDYVAGKGIPHLIILTKIDLLCGQVEKDVSNVFGSEKVEMAVNRAATIMNVPRNQVFPVKNYERETQLQTNLNILALSALSQALLFADDYLENQSQLEKESALELNSKD